MEKCIDISKHQTSFNATTCKKENIGTVICRLAYSNTADTKLATYAPAVKNAGMKLGGYGFGTWHYKSKNNSNLNTARTRMQTEVDQWIALATHYGLTSWLAIDQELEPNQQLGLSKGDNTSLLIEAAERIKKAGFYPCLYASASWIMANVDLTRFTYPLWVAYYKWYGIQKSFSNVPEAFPANTGTYGQFMNSNKSRICLWQFTSEGYASDYGCTHSTNNLDKNWLYFQPDTASNTYDSGSNVNTDISYTTSTRLSNGEVLMNWPVADHRITAGWTYSDGSAHRALDFGVPEGTPIIAPEDAQVNWLQYWDGKTKTGNQSYGNSLKLLHAPYSMKTLETLYGHMKTILVKNGDKVKAGQVIGYSGNTGNSTGPHLHFEVRLNGVKCNPLNWLDDDFYKAYTTVNLGTFKSVTRPSGTSPSAPVESPSDSIYFKKYTGTSGSIVAALNAIGEESSYTYRSQIAKVNGYPTGYKGTAAQNTALLNLLKQGKLIKPANYFQKYSGTSTSIITAMKAIGADSSYTYRSKVAAVNGITNYTGTASQNLQMVSLLKQGLLIKP